MLHIKELKKTDLHCHLDGSLSAATLSHFLNRMPDVSELSVDESCTSLTEYLKKFDLPLQCLQTKANLELASYAFLKELAADQMKYIEVRFAPALSTQDGLSCEDVIESVLRGLEKGKSETGIDYNVITCAMRHFEPEQNMKLLDSMEPYIGHGVCALDLAGDESRFPNPLFHELFEEARYRKIPFVIHSGETGNVENVRTAMEYGTSRIGHGLALIQDPDLMQEIARRGIGVEMCPTSNLQTHAIDSWNHYPLDTFLQAGVKVSVNTDNRTVSSTTMTRELERIQNLYGSDDIIRQVVKNAEETAFKKL